MAEPRDVALGVAVVGTRTGLVAGRLMLRPAQLVLRAPVLGSAVRQRADALAVSGARRTRATPCSTARSSTA